LREIHQHPNQADQDQDASSYEQTTSKTKAYGNFHCRPTKKFICTAWQLRIEREYGNQARSDQYTTTPVRAPRISRQFHRTSPAAMAALRINSNSFMK